MLHGSCWLDKDLSVCLTNQYVTLFCLCCAVLCCLRVPGLVWRDVRCAEDVTAVLREGWRARATAATALNATSSRSHAVLCVKVRGQREGRPFTSLLHLVDLAGRGLRLG